MNNAQNLMNAVAAIRLASSEIEDLFTEFGNDLSGRQGRDGVRFRESRVPADPATSSVGWVQHSWRQSFVAAEGGRVRKSAQKGELTLFVDLGRPGFLAELMATPYLYLFWAPGVDSWVGNLEEDENFLDDAGPFVLVNDRIFVWHEVDEEPADVIDEFRSDPTSRAWFFVVPLFTINSRKKVHDDLVSPILNFLNGEIFDLPTGHPAQAFERDGTALGLKPDLASP